MRRVPSIQRAFLRLGLGLSLILSFLALVLGGSVARLVVLSDEFANTVSSLRAVDEIELNLLIATRAHQLFGETGEPRWKRQWKQSEAELVTALDAARRLSRSPDESALVGKLAQQVQTIREEVLAEPPDARTITRKEIAEAIDTADALIALNEQGGKAAVARAERWSTIALVVAGLTLALSLAGVFGVFRAAKRLIYLPMQRLRRSLALRAPASDSRIPEEGPVETREIAAGINELFERISAQRRQSLTFLAAVAHDLRNPMSSLRTAAQLAGNQSDPEKQQERLKLILRQVDRMNRLVEDLLDVTRVQSGQFSVNVEEGDVREVVRDAVALFSETSPGHALRITLPGDPVLVRHDPARLSQVLSNLISNAIKYSPDGGEVEVRLLRRDSQAVLEVSDTGLGIPPNERESIFEPFRRSGGARGEIPGVGLGLSVARRLVRAQGGEIELESEQGVGSTFRVVMPLA